jgi:hypothetical protein
MALCKDAYRMIAPRKLIDQLDSTTGRVESSPRVAAILNVPAPKEKWLSSAVAALPGVEPAGNMGRRTAVVRLLA